MGLYGYGYALDIAIARFKWNGEDLILILMCMIDDDIEMGT